VPDPAPDRDLAEGFARIRNAVDAGERDLRGVGFWRLLARVKADPVLSRRWADEAGEIDRRAFENGVRFRIPVWAGNAVLVGGTLVGGFAVGIALGTGSDVVAGIALLAAGGIWSVSVHCLAHWVVGRVVGIRFSAYFVGGPFPPRPGLKTAYATYLRAEPAARAWMHASGAVATKFAPFVALAFWPAADAPWWSAVGLLALGITDVVFSVRSSDWKKVRRERAIARAHAATAR
jgi:hypothetical protein